MLLNPFHKRKLPFSMTFFFITISFLIDSFFNEIPFLLKFL